MTTSTSNAPCAKKRRGPAAESEIAGHPLLGLQSAIRKCKEMDEALTDRSLNKGERRELLGQYRAFIRAAAMHAGSLLEMSYQRYEPLAD